VCTLVEDFAFSLLRPMDALATISDAWTHFRSEGDEPGEGEGGATGAADEAEGVGGIAWHGMA
jgi:hypothetical protein